ncbi:MAG: N-glycosylase/DNA lyase [Candidatus Thermoplasmatota archaeon]|nr:N-glycosylase/DNA lyase [Candidatus Thermoplasmatota archaeon]MBS3802119.1 N-glycosylase/DNA lyase [Candidatus Thermoplasmatota archaeon]
MTTLTTKIKTLKQDTQLTNTINQTIKTFKQYKKNATNNELFSELSYCILTANCQAQTCMNIQKTFPHSFSTATKNQIKKHLKKHHYRFPNIRSQYIIESQPYKNKFKQILKTLDTIQRRKWFIDKIKGLGMKEASHFLRNIGYDDYAIIDTHILSTLQTHKIIEKPKTITKNKYLQIEQQLEDIAKETELSLATLDLYLWYMQTGMILK